MHYKPKNAIQLHNNNYILEFLVTNSVVVDGEFLLEWYEYFDQPQVWYISYVPLFEPFI